MKKLLQQFESLSEEIKIQLESTKLEIETKSREVREMEMFGKFDSSAIDSFFNKPYTIVPRKDEEWFLVVPKFFDIQVGYLFKSDETYNIFLVNKYAHYLGGVPQEFERIFKFKRKLPAKVFDGVILTGEENQDEVWNRYKKYLTGRLGKDRIKIKRGRQFDLIAALIKDGILPFVPKPVAPEHTREPIWKKKIPEIERRRNMEFFQDAFDRFKKTGAIGVYWAMGTGKTLFGLEALSSISVDDKPNVVISGNSVMLREQWKEKLSLVSLPAPVEVHTYHSWHKLKDREFGLVIFDECHHLPANTFSKLSTLKADYRIGLSATPYREDGRTDYIFALTGFPIGLDWKVLLDLGLIKAPDITLYLARDYNQKLNKLGELLNDPVKTLIYSFGLSTGNRLSRKFDIPFVHGGTPVKSRREIIDSSLTTIISSAGREGLSIQDLQRTISYNFLFGSRQEETQFFGRLLHGDDKGEHIIMMTDEEYEKYGKRLYGIEEKGFKIRIMRC